MNISIFDLFSIGIGPSSSHTVGPMLAAQRFARELGGHDLIAQIRRVQVQLYGSLALTGKGHGTMPAIIGGLEDKAPDTVVPESMLPRMQAIFAGEPLVLAGKKAISFSENDLHFLQRETLPKHSNAMRFTAYSKTDEPVATDVFYSIGGGFIVSDAEFGQEANDSQAIPYSFSSARELLDLCHENHLTIAECMLANEKTWRAEEAIRQSLLEIAHIMTQCIQKGCETTGNLPGELQVKRRAAEIKEKIGASSIASKWESADLLSHLNLYAIAVNEENAAGGRIVTAPTNGAAGIVPAVLEYAKAFHELDSDDKICEYLLTAGAIAILYKKNASISGAEVGCQGEIGVASSMAAAGLTAIRGGTVKQIENAAEIAMEHHLGMTCDPIAGLVQIPCIERNAMGAIKAVNAARLALLGDGDHFVSLDKVIATMKQTGEDMMTIYKETSLGGLAVNHIEC